MSCRSIKLKSPYREAPLFPIGRSESCLELISPISGLNHLLLAVMQNCPPCWGKTALTWIGRCPAHATVALKVAWVSVFSADGSIPHQRLQVIFLDFGAQGAQVSNQHVIQSLRPEARNRLNAILMSGMFIGGALGSAGASFAWIHAGWNAVCGLGALFALAGLGVHIASRRHAKTPHTRH